MAFTTSDVEPNSIRVAARQKPCALRWTKENLAECLIKIEDDTPLESFPCSTRTARTLGWTRRHRKSMARTTDRLVANGTGKHPTHHHEQQAWEILRLGWVAALPLILAVSLLSSQVGLQPTLRSSTLPIRAGSVNGRVSIQGV